MPLAVDALYNVGITYSLYNQNIVNSYYFRTKPDSHSDTIEEEVEFLADDVKVWIIDPFLAVACEDLQLVGTAITTLFPPDAPVAFRAYVGVHGSVAGKSLPSFAAVVLSMQTGLRGKRLHGRTYLAGVPESSVNANELTGAALDGWQNIANNVVNRYGKNGTSTRVFGGVYSRANGVTRDPGPPPTLHWSPLAHVPWDRGIARRIIFTQRHRLEGHGI